MSEREPPIAWFWLLPTSNEWFAPTLPTWLASTRAVASFRTFVVMSFWACVNRFSAPATSSIKISL